MSLGGIVPEGLAGCRSQRLVDRKLTVWVFCPATSRSLGRESLLRKDSILSREGGRLRCTLGDRRCQK